MLKDEMKNNKDYDAGKLFDSVSETYDKGLSELLGTENTEKYVEYKIQLLRHLLPCSPHNVLDFGCGTGRSLSYLKDYFCISDHDLNLYGCDVSKDSLQYAKCILPEAIIFSDYRPESLYEQECKWDLVLMACVLHHIVPSERKEWIKAITENIAVGGYLAVFEHNMKNPYTKKIVNDPRNATDIPEYMMTQKELTELLLGSNPNLSVWWKGYTCFSPFRNNSITKLESHLGSIPFGAQHCVIAKISE